MSIAFRPSLFLVTLAFILAPLHGQTEKRPLTFNDIDGWRNISKPILSRDGQWLAYSFMPQYGNGDVYIRHLPTERDNRLAVGAVPPPTFPRPTNPTERRPKPPSVGLNFTGDSRFLVATTLPTLEAMRAARIAGTKYRLHNLLITELKSGKTEKIRAIKSVQVPAQGGPWAAYMLAPVEPKEPAATGKKKVRALGSTLFLRNLTSGRERTFSHVTEYSFARDGKTLLYAVSAPWEHRNGVYAVSTENRSRPVALLKGKGRYLKIAWNLAQTQAAFLSNHHDVRAAKPKLQIYVWNRGSGPAGPVITAGHPGMPADLYISEKAAPVFSRDGKKLFVEVAPIAPKAAPKPLDPEDKVNADIWGGDDGLIQSRQEVRAGVERNRTYTGVLDLGSGRYTQIGTKEMSEALLSDNGDHALGCDYEPYLKLRVFDGTYGDIYLIDPVTGKRNLVIKKLRGKSGDEGKPSLRMSPDGHRAVYFQDNQWHSLDLNTGNSQNLTARLPHAFQKEDHDNPEPPTAYGWGGWMSDSQSLILYDRYDIWRVWPGTGKSQNITQGFGRKNRIILRVQNIAVRDESDPARGLDTVDPLILRGESDQTRASGYFHLALGQDSAPKKLLWGDKDYRYAGRAREADTLMLTAMRFDEFPDIWVTTKSFSKLNRVTHGGDQLKPFAWGTAELINYRNPDGIPLQGALYKPANFDPKKKYPLIIYTYERLSQIVHRFFPPTYGSNISFPLFTSNGYLVLLTDISYTTGYPGRSALDCVNAALDAVIARGFVDENRLGIQGSSWGGYQSAYIITHSDRFHAAEAGAVVGNMTSAYGGIRTTSGQPRLFQYEQTQSRIGQSLTEAPELYIENSPVFYAQNAQTPLLIQHNDLDGAVPWSQAVELYLALRRHDKPVWLLNYPKEGHGLIRRANQKDFSLRMWQFFEHYLHDAPEPDWMKKGVPYLDRDAEKLRFNK